jgi:hypothetical protein
MKSIRYLAAFLMILTGVMHVLPIFKSPQDSNALPMLIFGIIYFGIGVLLILKHKYSYISGIVFPLIGLGTGFFVVGINNWDVILSIMFAIDAIVVICCVLLILNKSKSKIS